MANRKYIFITGGVISSLGKGTIASSTGRILKDHGLKVTNIKCEMYVNIDSGTIRPTEHGEVFVTDDGLEADQDLGNYERFTGNDMGKVNFMTTGQVYQTVIERERNLEYEGEDVEVVPHVPEEVIKRIKQAGDDADAEVVITEFGGTVGEYQLVLYLEAARMMEREMPDDVIHVHVSYLPIPQSIGEMKTKPAQYSVRTLNAAGIQPDFLIGRSEQPIDESRKEKLAWIIGVEKEDIFSSPDCDSIYRVPLILEEQNYAERLFKKMGREMPDKGHDDRHDEWNGMVARLTKAQEKGKELKIGIVGKYFETGEFTLEDS
ncbi:MAG: CTP synthase, partial [Candidatus Andersenbacteria bacterium]|nr:CTP synthase [Candidatus Andersenbacteria bacterium]